MTQVKRGDGDVEGREMECNSWRWLRVTDCGQSSGSLFVTSHSPHVAYVPMLAPYQATDQSDWLLDSALGRWLASRRFVFTNLTLLKVLLWLVLLGLFAELEFGLPFFVLSLFYWLYEGLRSPAARQPGEMSAYSVFNPDCEPLLGALTAEQLEGEMGYGHLASHLY
ncbi:SAYSvFN domain-containing protein 1-like [Pungitius pungitius]|uniref:SAYSvFN domain-containing protein 1-like n=1 Tax=Pungitius pungitius TaxID=134920 RepID=UPI002E103FBD